MEKKILVLVIFTLIFWVKGFSQRTCLSHWMSDYSYQKEYGYPMSIPKHYKGKIVFKFWFNDDLEFLGYELKKDKLKSEIDPIYFNKIIFYCGEEKESVNDSDYKYYQLIRVNFKNNKLTKSIVSVSLTQLKKRNRVVLFL